MFSKNALKLLWVGLLAGLFSPAHADPGEEPSLSVFPGGMGIHTIQPSPPRLIELMPRRIDQKTGYLVLNPGLGLVYRQDSYQFQGLFIKDSFDNPAVALTGGYEFETGYPWFDLGASLGLYTRKSPRGCYEFSDGVYCYTDTNEIPLLMHATVGDTYLDLAILPLLNIGVHFPIMRSVHVELSFNSAVFLSFLTLGLRFDL